MVDGHAQAACGRIRRKALDGQSAWIQATTLEESAAGHFSHPPTPLPGRGDGSVTIIKKKNIYIYISRRKLCCFAVTCFVGIEGTQLAHVDWGQGS